MEKLIRRLELADPRITKRLIDLLDLPMGSCILDVGAGTGNYSRAIAEAGYNVSAIEPSRVMREQGKKHSRLSWHDGCAEILPFSDGKFDGLIMTLCMHHFSDWKQALLEARRVVGLGPIVIFTFDTENDSKYWLFDYFPSFRTKDKTWFPKLVELRAFVENVSGQSFEAYRFPLPHDLLDHFGAAGWSRPEIYLDENYRGGISSFSSVDEQGVISGLKKLTQDLKSGDWDLNYGHLREAKSLDVGYTFLKIKKGEQTDADNHLPASQSGGA